MTGKRRPPVDGRTDGRTGRSRPRSWWLLATALVVAFGVLVATWSASRPRSDTASTAPNACASQAATMGTPWHLDQSRGAASPGSALDRAQLWTPPYPAAENAAKRAEGGGQTQMARRLRQVAAQPRGVWFTDASLDPAELTARVASIVRSAASAGQVPILVTYAIPLRDCGGASDGGAVSSEQYLTWIRAFAAGLSSVGGSGPGAVVIVEPDALALLDRLPIERRAERLDLLRTTIASLSKLPSVTAYLDAGNGGWVRTGEMAQRLSHAGVAMARGFALNVSNFRSTQDELRYGQELAPLIGWKRFVVDTGRNGSGPSSHAGWCNPPGRALGFTPRSNPAPLVDAYLWVKPPGESDGACRDGQPAAGVFWPAYADELARASGW